MSSSPVPGGDLARGLPVDLMLPAAALGKKLDLSKLTDEEAKHVFKVVQRDFDLRKKEEDRLGDLKTQIEKEDTKRELLVGAAPGAQASLSDSLCIRCLQPFKFLVNSKRQCLDCQLYACKACSRYNKKERGWVCDACRMARVLKIGTLEWYHENVRTRFKRFGSAKVMRSLFKRLSGDHSASVNDLRAPREDDTHSMPEVNNAYEDPILDTSDGQQHYRSRSSAQDGVEGGVRDSAVADAEVTAMFQQIQEEFGDPDRDVSVASRRPLNHHMSMDIQPQRYDDGMCAGSRMVRARSLSRGSQSGHLLGRQEDEDFHPLYQAHSLNPLAAPPITELNRRVSAIESLLNRLEEQVAPPSDKEPASSSAAPRWEPEDLEELQLRRKLDQLTGNISDHGLTSEEDEPRRPASPRRRSLREDAPPTDPLQGPTATQEELLSTGNPLQLERKGRPLEDSSKPCYRSSTASVLFELEGKVAQAAASVQSTQSEMSDIENRIAALSAASGTPVSRKTSTSLAESQSLSHDFPTSQTDMFARNSQYRGSLTQRNPSTKQRRRPACAKPVMAQGP